MRVGMLMGGITSLAALLAFATTAGAGPAGRWTQITRSHSGARANLGLAREKGGTLHVLWAGPRYAPFTAIYDTPISPSGAVGNPHPVLSGWSGVNPPTATVGPDGSIHVVVSGQKTGAVQDPYNGLNEIVGPGTWKLGPHAFGSSSVTVASNAIVSTGALKNGQLATVWRSAATMLFQVGVDPAAKPQDVTPPVLGDSPVLAVDQGSGAVVIAYHGVKDGQNYFRQILPSLGAPQAIPQSKVDSPQIAARAGGGVYTAFAPDSARVLLVRYGGGTKSVPVPKGTQVLTAGLAAGPEGRLWVFYGNAQKTYVTRTSKGVSGFEPVQTFASPPNLAQYFRLEGEGSSGPLDLFLDLTSFSQPKTGSWHTHVLPALSLRAARRTLKNGVRVTVRVLDAGDPVAGARVTGLPGGPKTTGADGAVVVTAGKKGSFAVTASKAGYVSAKGRVSL
jgi:hypothetical protein